MKFSAPVSVMLLAGLSGVSALVSAPAYSRPLPPPMHGMSVSQENVSYGYAEVLRVDPIHESVRYGEPEQRCDGGPYGTDGYQRVDGGDPTGGTVIGGVVGGALGNQVGKGNGRKVATVAGVVAGALIGRNIDSANGAVGPVGGGCRMVMVERTERRVVAYDVEYRYKGEIYGSRLSYDPGNRLRVRVGVAPVDESGSAEYR